MSFIEEFKIKKGDIIGLTGGGGKTSLMFRLAQELSRYGKVLVTTTTKIFEPGEEEYEKFICIDVEKKGKNRNIDVVGSGYQDGKVKGITSEELEKFIGEYDYILVEADGSRGRPLKYWKGYEPVIPYICTKVIGILNISLLFGKKIEENLVHHYEEFLKVYGLKGNEPLDEHILTEYLKTGEFFKGFSGEKYFFFNGIESLAQFDLGAHIADEIEIPIVMGSMELGEAYAYKRLDGVVLGAGFSKRMGFNKLLLEVREGKSMIDILMEKIELLPIKEIIFIGREMEEKGLTKKIKYVENKRAHLGQSESVKLGVLNSKNEGIIFFPADQPYIEMDTLKTLIWEFQKTDRITFPKVGEERFSPVIFPKKYRGDLLKLEGDTGGREIIRSNKSFLNPVKFSDIKEFKDIDTPEDI